MSLSLGIPPLGIPLSGAGLPLDARFCQESAFTVHDSDLL